MLWLWFSVRAVKEVYITFCASPIGENWSIGPCLDYDTLLIEMCGSDLPPLLEAPRFVRASTDIMLISDFDGYSWRVAMLPACFWAYHWRNSSSNGSLAMRYELFMFTVPWVGSSLYA